MVNSSNCVVVLNPDILCVQPDAPNAIGQAGPSSASDIAGRNNMVVKAEEVNLIDAEDDERFVLFR